MVCNKDIRLGRMHVHQLFLILTEDNLNPYLAEYKDSLSNKSSV